MASVQIQTGHLEDAAIALANVSQSSDASLQSAYRDMPLITIHSVLRSCEAAKTPIERQQPSNINNSM